MSYFCENCILKFIYCLFYKKIFFISATDNINKIYVSIEENNTLTIYLPRYICNDPTKKVIDMTNPQSQLLDSIIATCLINGKYSIDVNNFGCIGKDKFKYSLVVKCKTNINFYKVNIWLVCFL